MSRKVAYQQNEFWEDLHKLLDAVDILSAPDTERLNTIAGQQRGIVPEDAIWISKDHFNKLCQFAAKHKHGRCDCYDTPATESAGEPSAVKEGIASAQPTERDIECAAKYFGTKSELWKQLASEFAQVRNEAITATLEKAAQILEAAIKQHKYGQGYTCTSLQEFVASIRSLTPPDVETAMREMKREAWQQIQAQVATWHKNSSDYENQYSQNRIPDTSAESFHRGAKEAFSRVLNEIDRAELETPDVAGRPLDPPCWHKEIDRETGICKKCGAKATFVCQALRFPLR